MSDKNKDQVDELSDDQIQSVAAAGAPRKGVVACTSPSGDIAGKRKGVVVCATPNGDIAGKRAGVIACESPNGD